MFGRCWETVVVRFDRHAFAKNRSLPSQSRVCVVRENNDGRAKWCRSAEHTSAELAELAWLFLTRKIRVFARAALFACSTPDSRIFRPTLFYAGTYAKCSAPELRDMNFIVNVSIRWRKRRKRFPTWSVGFAQPAFDRHTRLENGKGSRRVRSFVSRETDENLDVVVGSIKSDSRVWRAVMVEQDAFLGVSFHPRHGRKTNILCAFRVRSFSNNDGPIAWCRSLPNHVFVDKNGRYAFPRIQPHQREEGDTRCGRLDFDRKKT